MDSHIAHELISRARRREAILFYLCPAEVFMGGDVTCGDYGDYSPDYWWFDPAPFFD